MGFSSVGPDSVSSIAAHITLDHVFLWMGVVGLVALVEGLVMDVIAQRRDRASGGEKT